MGALIVGYDDSECARAALATALELARETGDRLVIGFGYDPGGPGEEQAALREEIRKFGERATAPALERARGEGVAAEVALVAQRPVDALLALAEEHDARAIVVGTFGEHPIKGAILGSTPHKLVHVSARPVLIVPVADE